MTVTGQLSVQLRGAMRRSNRNQQKVASDLGKAPARISDLLRGLDTGKSVNDRLTLMVEMADLLGMVPVLVPKRQLEQVMTILGQAPPTPMTGGSAPSLFDDVFIDLSDDDEDFEAGVAR